MGEGEVADVDVGIIEPVEEHDGRGGGNQVLVGQHHTLQSHVEGQLQKMILTRIDSFFVLDFLLQVHIPFICDR